MAFRTHVFMIFALLLIVPILLFAFIVYMYLANDEKEQLLAGRQSMLLQIGQNVDLIVDDASRSALSILFNNYQLQLLRKYDQTTSTVKTRTDENQMKNYLQSVVYQKQYIEGMTYISSKGHVFSSLHDNEYRDYIDISLLPYMETAQQSNGRPFLIFDTQLVYFTQSETGLLSLVRPIRDPLNLRVLGIMKVDFRKAYVQTLIEQLDGYYIWRNRNGDMLFQDEEGGLAAGCYEPSCLQVTSPAGHLQIAYKLPSDYFAPQVETISRWIALYVVFILVAAMLISYFIVRKMLQPLVVLKNYLTTYGLVKVPVNRQQLEPYLASYDGMIGEIDTLVNNIHDATKKNLEMEYKVRQSQMDPHFLFNTLEMLNMKALTSGDLEMSDMIVQLSKCFRYHIKQKDVDVTLQDEIAFAKAYLSLMTLRFRERLIVQWTITTDSHQTVPKYLIQPLVENAIIHGMRQQGEPLHLHIIVEQQDEALVIHVHDDGQGMSHERLQKIRDKFHAPSLHYDDEMGIALVNIEKLLRYGLHENNRLVIESAEGQGTSVTIFLYGGDEQ